MAITYAVIKDYLDTDFSVEKINKVLAKVNLFLPLYGIEDSQTTETREAIPEIKGITSLFKIRPCSDITKVEIQDLDGNLEEIEQFVEYRTLEGSKTNEIRIIGHIHRNERLKISATWGYNPLPDNILSAVADYVERYLTVESQGGARITQSKTSKSSVSFDKNFYLDGFSFQPIKDEQLTNALEYYL